MSKGQQKEKRIKSDLKRFQNLELSDTEDQIKIFKIFFKLKT